MSDDDVERARERARPSLKILPLFAITALICWALVHQWSSAEKMRAAMERADPVMLALPVALMGVSLVLSSIRWRIILHSMGVRLSGWRALSIILGTWPLALVTPSRASDLLRAVAIREKLPVSSGSSSVVAEKLVDVQSLCILGVLGSAWAGLWTWTGLIALLLVSEWTAAAWMLRSRERVVKLPLVRRVEGIAAKLFDAFVALRRSPAHFAALSATSLVAWVVALGIVHGLMGVFGAEVALHHVVALWPVSIFVGMLPLTVAGVGTRDAAFITLLGWTSSGAPEAGAVLAATFSYALITAVLPAVVGIPFMFWEMRQWLASSKEDTAS
ncbi:MAG: lysylphosphatidylglycerol synthase transmembrane domain-containing protein [Myxococcota bacterium]